MAHKKCVICSEPLADEQGVPYKGRFAHQRCFNTAIKVLAKDKSDKVADAGKKRKGKRSAPKAELKSGMSEEDYAHKRDYYDYVRTLIGDSELSTKVYVLSEEYIKRYGFTFLSMRQTLTYLHEVTEKELTGDIVGIIPYYHSEATKYYDDLARVNALNTGIDTSTMYGERVVHIRPNRKPNRQINIESVGKEA